MTPPPAEGSSAGHPQPGKLRQVTPYAAVLLCDNPSVMTLEGTNTWILRAPGREESVVVDPGPKDKKHLKKVAKTAGTVALTLVTHRQDTANAYLASAVLAKRVAHHYRLVKP